MLWFISWFLIAYVSLSGQVESRQCGYPGKPRNGSSHTAKPISRPGDTVQYTCRDGFTLFGEEERVCLHSGIWAGSQPLCEFNLALDKSSVVSSTLWNYRSGLAVDGDTETCMFTPRSSEQRWWQVDLGKDYKVGSVAIVINKGVIQISPTVIKQHTLQDTYQEFTIFVIQLLSKTEALYKPCNTFKGRFQNSRILFPCQNGDGHNGRYIYVRDDRRDQEYFGLCEVEVFAYRGALCGDPEEPVGGHATLTTDGTAMYTCDTGLKLLAEPNRTCEKNGRWAGHSPQCEAIKCGHPPLFPNSNVELLNQTSTWNSVALYSCKAGYSLSEGVKQMTTTCLNTGEWEKISFACIPDRNRNLPIKLPGRDWDKPEDHEKKKSADSDEVDTPGIISIGIIGSLIIIILIIIFAILIKRYQAQKCEHRAGDDFTVASTMDNTCNNYSTEEYLSTDSTMRRDVICENPTTSVLFPPPNDDIRSTYNTFNASLNTPNYSSVVIFDTSQEQNCARKCGNNFIYEQSYPLNSLPDYSLLRGHIKENGNYDMRSGRQESEYDIKQAESAFTVETQNEKSMCTFPSTLKTFLQPAAKNQNIENENCVSSELMAVYAQVDLTKKKKHQLDENNTTIPKNSGCERGVSFSKESGVPASWNVYNTEQHTVCGVLPLSERQIPALSNTHLFPSSVQELNSQNQMMDYHQL